MKINEKLFELIRSLTKSEKRYFKQVSNLHRKGEGNHYIKLFDAIEKQKVYDEAAIKSKFSREPFVKRLDAGKYHLYNLVLKSLELYHSTIDSELRSGINQLDVLLRKGLFDHCHLLAVRLEQKAIKYEKYTSAFEIIRSKNRLLFQSPINEKTKTEMQENYRAAASCLDKNKNTIDYTYLANRALYLYSRSLRPGRNPDQEKEWESILKEPLLKIRSRNLPLNSQINKYDTLSLFGFVNNDWEKYYFYLSKINALFETNSYLIIENTSNYIVFLTNLFMACSQLKKKEEQQLILGKLKNISVNYPVRLSKGEEVKIFTIYSMVLHNFIETGEFIKLNEVLPEIESGLIRHKERLPKIFEVSLYYNIAYLSFINRNYKKSLLWINKILNDDAMLESELELIYFATVFKLILYYELNYTEQLPYGIKSAQRILSKNKESNELELLLVNFFKDLIKTNGSKELKNKLTDLRVRSKKIFSSSPEKTKFENFDIFSWIESKIESRPFADVLREKIKM